MLSTAVLHSNLSNLSNLILYVQLLQSSSQLLQVAGLFAVAEVTGEEEWEEDSSLWCSGVADLAVPQHCNSDSSSFRTPVGHQHALLSASMKIEITVSKYKDSSML